MIQKSVLQRLQALKAAQQSAFVLLVDPDDADTKSLEKVASIAMDTQTGFIFVGGSLMVGSKMRDCIATLKKETNIPIVIFPGNPNQVEDNADALLFLSLISGRNPELLIGQHVVAAPQIIKSGLEVISTGYILIDGGKPTTVSYISHSLPIPADKPEIALCTAWAGQLLGQHLIYMDAGSGAAQPISDEMVALVSQQITLPLIVGGGIKTPEKIQSLSQAGAQAIVVGNAIEKDISLFKELVAAI